MRSSSAAKKVVRRERRKLSTAQESLRDLRRGQIVAAARALVAEGGLDGLSFRTLEDKLGFTRGVVTYHFEDKDEIVAAVLGSAVAEIDAATRAEVEDAHTVRELVRAVLQTKVRGFLDHPEASEILIAFWGRHADRGPVQEAMAGLFGNYRGQSVQLIRMAQRDSRELEVDAPALAALLVGIVVGLVVQARFEPRAVNIGAALEEAERTIVARLQPRET